VSGSLTLRDDHRLRVFDNRVLRGMCGPKVEEVTGGCRKSFYVLFTRYYQNDQVKSGGMVRTCSTQE
jgi:hypothetical protein